MVLVRTRPEKESYQTRTQELQPHLRHTCPPSYWLQPHAADAIKETHAAIQATRVPYKIQTKVSTPRGPENKGHQQEVSRNQAETTPPRATGQ